MSYQAETRLVVIVTSRIIVDPRLWQLHHNTAYFRYLLIDLDQGAYQFWKLALQSISQTARIGAVVFLPNQ